METEDSNPLVTVIIPVYNAEKHLRRGLDSLLAQTCGDWEAVCIDDGSTDGSAAVLEEYAARDARFRVLRQENSGVSVARNRGIREARGAWVTFLDADDWFSPELVEGLLAAPCTERVDVIGFGIVVEYEEGVTRDESLDASFRMVREGEYPSTPETVEYMWGSCGGKAYRRDFLLENAITFPLGMRQEDEVFYRCAMGVARNFYLWKYYGYHYLQANESYMHMHTAPCEIYLLYLKGMHITNAYYRAHECSQEWSISLLTFLFKQLRRWDGALTRKEARELRRQTRPFLTEGRFAEHCPAGDYRMRYLSLLPWWVEPFSHRGWSEERFKLFNMTFMKDCYADCRFVLRVSPWSKIKKLLGLRQGNN